MAVFLGRVYGRSHQLDLFLNHFFILLTLLHALRIFSSLTFTIFTPLYILFGSFITDFISGTVHMILDNLRLAEEHHEKPYLITQKPYYVQNGESLLFDICLYFLFPDYQVWLWSSLFGIFVEINHAYQHEIKVPKLVEALWKTGFFVSSEEHKLHHLQALKGEGKNYCLLTGGSEKLVLLLERGLFPKR